MEKMSGFSKFLDKHFTHKTERRKAGEAINAQIEYYKNETAKANQILEDAKTERENQKKKVQEKQIRSMRSKFRSPGFLDSSPEEQLG